MMNHSLQGLDRLPRQLHKHPVGWSKDDVLCWISWCVSEFSFIQPTLQTWNMNGKALCLLSKEDFLMRIPNTGDVLYNCLLHLQEVFSASASPSASAMYAEQSFAWPMEETAYHDVTPYTQYGRSVAYLPTSLNAIAQQINGIYPNCAAEQCFHDNSNNNDVNFSLHNVTENELLDLSVKSERRESKDNGSRQSSSPSTATRPSHVMKTAVEQATPDTSMTDMIDSCVDRQAELAVKEVGSRKTDKQISSKLDSRRLWEFLDAVLHCEKYRDVAKWEDRTQGIFCIVNPGELARLWGIHKNRPGMTYEKLSRALRYYYRLNIINRVPNKRLTYRFLASAEELKVRVAKEHADSIQLKKNSSYKRPNSAIS